MAYDLMGAVVARLTADAGIVAAFQHTAAVPKFQADEANVRVGLPYLVYSEPDEDLNRVWGNQGYASGKFEVGVFDTTKKGARQKLDLVKRSLNALPMPVPLDDGGSLFYLHHRQGSSRKFETPAAGQGVTEFGRTMVFDYLVTRNDT